LAQEKGLKLTKLAEAYFHLKDVNLSQDSLNSFGNFTSLVSAQVASGIFHPDSMIEVRLSEGSIKGWVTVTGLVMTYGVIADYKGFKESIVEIHSDAKKFGNYVTEEIFKSKDLKGSHIYRIERRTKTPGRIKRLIDRREWLDAHSNQLSIGQVQQENIEIERLLQQILVDIAPSERAVIRNALGEFVPHLPPTVAPRVVLPLRREEQIPLMDGDQVSASDPVADYLRRFRLSDGPN
jgi:hypothetical protein